MSAKRIGVTGDRRRFVGSTPWRVLFLTVSLQMLACQDGGAGAQRDANVSGTPRDAALPLDFSLDPTSPGGDLGFDRSMIGDIVDASVSDGDIVDASVSDGDTLDASVSDDATEGGGEAGSDLNGKSCPQAGGLYFSPPVALVVPGGHLGPVMTAASDGRVAVAASWPGREGTQYLESVDGGRNFKPPIVLTPSATANRHIALGKRHAYISGASFEPASSVFVWNITTAVPHPTVGSVQFGPWDTYVGVPVAAADGRATVFLQNDSLDLKVTEGTYVSSTADPDQPFGEPTKLFERPEAIAGLYHSNGKLYIAYGRHQPTTMTVRWSGDNGGTFSEPVVRSSTGGQVWPPKLFETANGQVLITTREGYALSPPQRTVAVSFDVASGQFAPANVVQEGPIVCWDFARLGSGRVFSTSTSGRPGNPEDTTLRFSDDDGRSWSPGFTIPHIARGNFCPTLAASRDELYLMWSVEHADTIFFARAGSPGVCDSPP